MHLELERVLDPARRPGPEEKLTVNKPNTQYYPGPILGQARELFDKLDKSKEIAGYTRLEKSSKNFKGMRGSSPLSQLPKLSSGPKIDTQNSSVPKIFEPVLALSTTHCHVSKSL